MKVSHWLLRNNAQLERRLTIKSDVRRYDPSVVVLKLTTKHHTWAYARAEFSRLWLIAPHQLDVTECPDVTQLCVGMTRGSFVAMVNLDGTIDVFDVVTDAKNVASLRTSFSEYAAEFFQPER